MGFQDAFWHICNFFAPALTVAGLGAAAVKLAWRQTLNGLPWWLLALCAAGASSLALMTGLVLTGRDGSMSTYAGMVVVCALTLWYVAFVKRR